MRVDLRWCCACAYVWYVYRWIAKERSEIIWFFFISFFFCRSQSVCVWFLGARRMDKNSTAHWEQSRMKLVRKSILTLYQIQSRGTCLTLFSVCATYMRGKQSRWFFSAFFFSSCSCCRVLALVLMSSPSTFRFVNVCSIYGERRVIVLCGCVDMDIHMYLLGKKSFTHRNRFEKEIESKCIIMSNAIDDSWNALRITHRHLTVSNLMMKMIQKIVQSAECTRVVTGATGGGPKWMRFKKRTAERGALLIDDKDSSWIFDLLFVRHANPLSHKITNHLTQSLPPPPFLFLSLIHFRCSHRGISAFTYHYHALGFILRPRISLSEFYN